MREPGAGGAVVVFTDVSERVRMEAALRDARERAARERLAAAEAERARWARELHDETLQGMAAVHVLLSSGIRAAAADDMRGRMRLAQEQIESELDKLRGLISDLRPAALDELGLEASVRDLAERTQVVYGIEVETTLALRSRAGEAVRPASEVETAAYRIAQECLVERGPPRPGARASPSSWPRPTARCTCACATTAAASTFATRRRGFGLRGMRERVDLLDGRLAIASSGERHRGHGVAAAHAGLSGASLAWSRPPEPRGTCRASAKSAGRSPPPARARARSRRGPSGASGRACAGCARGGSRRCAR